MGFWGRWGGPSRRRRAIPGQVGPGAPHELLDKGPDLPPGVLEGDGPRGPAQIAKPGVTQLAALVSAPVGAVYLHPNRSWVLRSWDRFLFPKPFSRVTVAWTVPVIAEQQAVQSALDRAVKLAETNP